MLSEKGEGGGVHLYPKYGSNMVYNSKIRGVQTTCQQRLQLQSLHLGHASLTSFTLTGLNLRLQFSLPAEVVDPCGVLPLILLL